MVSPNKEGGVFKAVETKPFSGENAHSPSSPFEIKEGRKPWSRRARIFIAGLITAIAAGTGAYVADQQGLVEIPGIHQIIDNDNGARPFDINKLDQKQEVIFGQNAQIATPQQIDEFIKAPSPELKLASDPGEIPELQIMLSLDLTKAGKITIYRSKISGMAMNLIAEVENQVSLTAIPKGSNTDFMEILLEDDGSHRDLSVLEKFKMENGDIILLRLSGITISDEIKDAPTINLATADFNKDVRSKEGKPFPIKANSFLSTRPQGTTYITPFLIRGSEGSPVPITLSVINGNLLFSSPTS